MLAEIEGKRFREVPKLCLTIGVKVTPVKLKNIILLHGSLLLAEKTLQEYQEEFGPLKIHAWQTLENSPRFYFTLDTRAGNRDKAEKRRVGFATTARFYSSSVMSVVVVEISNRKLKQLNSERYYESLEYFIKNHSTTSIMKYESL